MYVPKKLFLTKGVGVHKEKLFSFELALRDAKIAPFNLVKVSSIYPPSCEIVSIENGLKHLSDGQVVHCVMSETSSNEYNRLLAASVGLAIPQNEKQHGYLSEHHAFGMTDEECGDYAEDLAAEMLGTILGLEYDPNASYDIKRDVWKMSDQIVKTKNITQSSIVKRGLWTTVISVAILIP